MSDASPRLSRWGLVCVALVLSVWGSCAPPASVDRAEAVSRRRRDAGVRDLREPDLSAAWLPPDATAMGGPAPDAPDGAVLPPMDPPAPPGLHDGGVGGDLLEGTVTDAGPGTTDLSTVGSLDWVHFGFQGTLAINRKRSPEAPFIMMSPPRATPIGRSSADFSRFLWSDGKPVRSARAVQSGFETGSAMTGGFQLTVHGDRERIRTVSLWVGASVGAARLTARLGTVGAPLYEDRLTADSPRRNRVYTLTFRSSNPARPLTIDWTIDPAGEAPGDVRIQAVTLAERPSEVELAPLD
jgi:hypothetical protein